MSSIKLSPKHGVNPSLTTCFYCGEPIGVALLGRIKDDAEAPRRICLDTEPCDDCKKHMAHGVILISVRDGESGPDPYRTGCFCVVTEDAISRWVNDAALLASILEKRVAFLPDETWDAIGLPRG